MAEILLWAFEEAGQVRVQFRLQPEESAGFIEALQEFLNIHAAVGDGRDLDDELAKLVTLHQTARVAAKERDAEARKDLNSAAYWEACLKARWLADIAEEQYQVWKEAMTRTTQAVAAVVQPKE